MNIRPARPADAPAWLELRLGLWPASRSDHEAEIAAFFRGASTYAACFVAERADGEVVGFVEMGLRSHAESCETSPVGYIEGIFVVPAHRRSGVGRSLVEAAEGWARARECTEMASDRELANEPSGWFHAALGYDEVGRIVCFRKSLIPSGEAE